MNQVVTAVIPLSVPCLVKIGKIPHPRPAGTRYLRNIEFSETKFKPYVIIDDDASRSIRRKAFTGIGCRIIVSRDFFRRK